MNKNQNTHAFSGTNMLLWSCLISSAAFLGLYALIDLFVEEYPRWLGLILFGVNALIILVIYFIYKRKAQIEADFVEKTLSMEKAMTGMMKNVEIPCVLTLRSGLIAWCSAGAHEMFGIRESMLQKSFNDICSVSIDTLINSIPEESEEGDKKHGSLPVIVRDRNYVAKIYRQTLGQNTYYLTTFEDCTDYEQLRAKTEAEYPVVAYIVLDNLEEIAQYVKVNYRSAANEIEEILKKFAQNMHGFIQEYSRDKYVMVFSKEKYNECAENKFDILETIRNVRLGDSSVPVTISMGISLIGDTFEEKEKNAASALDLALQRGGDQVAVKTSEEIIFFGGRTKSVSKKSGSFARVFATQLASHIVNAGNVIIMGHANPDFDSIGACVGVARLCMFCGLNPKIVMDLHNRNFLACTEKLRMLDEYKHAFISAEAGLDMIRSDTLLIIVDANNFRILESPDIADTVENIVIIDHHRKIAQFDEEPLLSHIEPSASSASEMVTEILEQCEAGETILKEEANVLLAGIMVDTKNFTRTTGTKTFAAAMYLRGLGGNSEIADEFFHENFEHFVSEAKFTSNVTMYLDRIAITESNGGDPDFDRVAAAKAADKLLSVKGVDASFALVEVNGTIHISARSNGSINVQLILEKLNGGGHFDIAGASIVGADMETTLYRLKDAIDEYFREV